MPKLIIPKSSLPPLNGDSESYFVRFRLIGEDRNNFSYWSPIFEIPVTISHTVGSVELAKTGTKIITAAWDQVQGVQNYDVWLAWDDGTTPSSWYYHTRTAQTSTVIVQQVGATKLSIRVYQETQQISEFNNFKLYQTLNYTIP